MKKNIRETHKRQVSIIIWKCIGIFLLIWAGLTWLAVRWWDSL